MKASSDARSRLLLSSIALLLCMLAPADLAAKKTADEAESRMPEVGGLKWRGNHTLSKRELQAVTFTQAPSWRLWEIWKPNPEFSESTLIGDLERVETLYELHGYYEARVTYALTWNDAHTVVAIVVTIDEGPTVAIAERRVAIPEELARELGEEGQRTLLADLPLEVDGPFSPDRYARSKQVLLERLADVGHPLAQVEGSATVDVAAHQARVEWQIAPGPLVRLGPVKIEGLYLVDEATARREIHIAEGDVYSPRSLERVRRGLQQQGLYRWVNVAARPPARPPLLPPSPASDPAASLEQVWPIGVRVTERPPHSVDVGVGYGTDESFRASLGWHHNNFLGDARKLRASALYSGILQGLETEFRQPYFIDSKTTFVAEASLRREDEPAYLAYRALAKMGLSRPISGPWAGRISYEISHNDVTQDDGSPDVILEEQTGITRVCTVEFGVRRETLDNILNPSKGTWLDLAVIPSARVIGSEFDFVTLLAEARAFLPLGPTVVANRLRIGATQPYANTVADEVPVVARFFAGGSNSMRGFRYHRMPPVNATQDNVGGTSLLEASTELRFPVWRKLGGVLFVDTGQLNLDPFRYDVRDLFWAAGTGLRYHTVVGPLRADFGYLLNPRDTGSDPFQWFVSVGHSF